MFAFIILIAMKVRYFLAQVNIGKIKAPLESDEMSGFVNNLERINELAENSAGFVWRLKEDNNNATSIKVFEDDYMLINMSVWESIESLYQFVYQSAHVDYLKRRKEWFEKMTEMYTALWWIPEGHTTTTAEAIERLMHIRRHGETPHAFSFKKKFTAAESLKDNY
jgi:hypothetical protein